MPALCCAVLSGTDYFHTAFAIHVFGVTGDSGRERRIRLPQLLSELERVEAEAHRDPLQVDEAAMRATRPQLAPTWTQQPAQPSDSMRATQPAGETTRAVQQHQVDPKAAHSLRWTESESEKGAGGSSSTVSAITGKLKRWTGAGGEEHSSTAAGGSGVEAGVGGGPLGAGPGEGSTASAAVGEALSGVKSTLGAAGHKMSEAAIEIQEKVSETFGDFKSKPFTH